MSITTTYGPIQRFEDPTRNLAPYARNRPPTVLRSADAVETVRIVLPTQPVSPAFSPGYAAVDPAATMTDLPAPAVEPERPRGSWRYRSKHRDGAPVWAWATFGAGAGLLVGAAAGIGLLWAVVTW